MPKKPRMYIGLDPATSMGVALLDHSHQKAWVTVLKGSPTQQWVGITNLVALVKDRELHFVMERLHKFRNAVVTRSLLERYGYLKYMLLNQGYPVAEVGPTEARSLLNIPENSKEDTFKFFTSYFSGVALTSDMTDALCVAYYQYHKDALYLDWNKFKIENIEVRR